MDRILVDSFRTKIINLTSKDEEIFIDIVNDLLLYTYILDDYATNKNSMLWLENQSNAQLVKSYFKMIKINFIYDRINSVAYIKREITSKFLKYSSEQSKIFFAVTLLYQIKKNSTFEIKDFYIRYSDLREHLIVTINLGKDSKKISDSSVKETLKIMKSQNLVDFLQKDCNEEDFTIKLLKSLEFVFDDISLEEFKKNLLEQMEDKGENENGDIEN